MKKIKRTSCTLLAAALLSMCLAVNVGANTSSQHIDIDFESQHIKWAYLYVNGDPDTLIIWMDGGYGQFPKDDLLGGYLSRGELELKDTAVLCPAAQFGCNQKSITSDELWELIEVVKEYVEFDKISIVGASNGSDAVAMQVAAKPDAFSRVCLLSNYSRDWWNDCVDEITADVLILVGAKEKRSRWDVVDELDSCEFYKVDGYGHNVGILIWLNTDWTLIDWLNGGLLKSEKSADLTNIKEAAS